MNKINKLAVFCGSKNGNDPLYTEHARELGKILGEHRIEVIFGGGKKGLMGAIADAAMEQSCTVRGVIPKMLTEWEHQHDQISELVVVDDMHIRKRMMYEMSDAVMILPGGFGTLDELFEVLTWNQLSIHNKKVFVLNSAGFYDHLLRHLEMMAGQGFLYTKVSEQIIVLSQPSELGKWLSIVV